MSNVYIIGAGAAGFFLAITLREISPTTHVTLVERASQPLTKVRATGGRTMQCHQHFAHIDQLQEVYPRGAALDAATLPHLLAQRRLRMVGTAWCASQSGGRRTCVPP